MQVRNDKQLLWDEFDKNHRDNMIPNGQLAWLLAKGLVSKIDKEQLEVLNNRKRKVEDPNLSTPLAMPVSPLKLGQYSTKISYEYHSDLKPLIRGTKGKFIGIYNSDAKLDDPNSYVVSDDDVEKGFQHYLEKVAQAFGLNDIYAQGNFTFQTHTQDGKGLLSINNGAPSAHDDLGLFSFKGFIKEDNGNSAIHFFSKAYPLHELILKTNQDGNIIGVSFTNVVRCMDDFEDGNQVGEASISGKAESLNNVRGILTGDLEIEVTKNGAKQVRKIKDHRYTLTTPNGPEEIHRKATRMIRINGMHRYMTNVDGEKVLEAPMELYQIGFAIKEALQNGQFKQVLHLLLPILFPLITNAIDLRKPLNQQIQQMFSSFQGEPPEHLA